ncbi:hypothetical protein KKA08_00680, partial [bacterium]|nr:hypothetical protein [bacterium]
SKITNKEIRQWAWVLAAVMTIVGLIQYFGWGHIQTATGFWIAAGFFLVIGTLIPVVLKPVYKGWLVLAAGLAWFNTRLILSIVFFLIFAPAGLVLRLFRVDLIKQRWNAKAESYWIDRSDQAFDRDRYENQY